MNISRMRSPGASAQWWCAPAVAALLSLGESPMVAQTATTAATTAAPLVFDGVTVVDVEQGTLRPDQRVLIGGTKIQAIGSRDAVPLPTRASVVDARGKYLIPGLWDLHVHSRDMAQFFYPLFIANGVTGVRDAGSGVPLATLIRWRREILEGKRVGPPRQLLSGPSLNTAVQCVWTQTACVDTPARARAFVDSLQAAGADMVKPRSVEPAVYAAVLAEARRVGLPAGGHMPSRGWSVLELADSGIRLLDHLTQWGDLGPRCWGPEAAIAQCEPVAEWFRRNQTWLVPTMIVQFQPPHGRLKASHTTDTLVARLTAVATRFWETGQAPSGNWLRLERSEAISDSLGLFSLVERVGLPVLAGTDTEVAPGGGDAHALWVMPPGFSLQTELALLVAEGLSPLNALQSATLNPARMWHATDSLGTVAPGKLADLVLLDANPLADITNTTTIRAVVANGRYFDRAALDRLLTEVRVSSEGEP